MIENSDIYARLDDIRETVTRSATLIETQGELIRAMKDDSETRWRDHEGRIRFLEMNTMSEADITKLTSSNAARIEELEKSAKAEAGMRQGISKSYLVAATAAGAIVGNLFPFINFIKLLSKQ